MSTSDATADDSSMMNHQHNLYSPHWASEYLLPRPSESRRSLCYPSPLPSEATSTGTVFIMLLSIRFEFDLGGDSLKYNEKKGERRTDSEVGG
jgi:hypothetical protein